MLIDRIPTVSASDAPALVILCSFGIAPVNGKGVVFIDLYIGEKENCDWQFH